MNIETDSNNGLLIIRLDGRLNADAANATKPQLEQMIAGSSGNVLMNFAKVEFIDSTGLGLLVSMYRRLREKDHDLMVCNLSSQAQTLFELTRMHRIFSIFEDEAAAIQAGS